MRTGRTILASVIAATIAGGAVAGWLAFSLGEHTQAVVAAALYAAAPLIGSVWLGVYALCAVALVTTMLSRALRRAGAGITQNAPAIAADPDGLARFLPPAWHRFAAESRDIVFGGGPEPQATLGLRLSAMPTEVRRACRRHYFGMLVRAQYPTALVLLLALVLVQWSAVLSEREQPLRALVAAMPAILLLFDLIVLGIVEKIMTLAGVAPFVQALARLPIESQETRLLGQLLESTRTAPDPSLLKGFDEDRLRAVVDAGQQPVLGAVARVADAVRRLDRSIRSDLDATKAAVTELAGATRLGDDAALRSQYRQAVEELQGAVAALGETVATMRDLSASLGVRLPVSLLPVSGEGEPGSGALLSLLRELASLSRELDADLPRVRDA